jgi:transcriptional regulator with GAF, ATPase, and Fis domain
MAKRETELVRTFVDVADTLVAEFDVVDFLTLLTTRCVDLFDVSVAALLLADSPRGLRLVASSNHAPDVIQLLEVQHDEGPAIDCYRSGTAVSSEDLAAATEHWPRFAPQALGAGWASVYALPMHLRAEVIGTLNLLRSAPGALPDADQVAAQALADVATIGILQHRAAEEHRLVADQLQYALDSRVAIEQAKGVLAEHAGLDMAGAFDAIRAYSRNHNERLAEVAEGIVERRISATDVAPERTR